MGTQVLAGSKGVYRTRTIKRDVFNETEFTLVEDVCLEAEKIVVKFKDAAESCWVYMEKVTFASDAKYRDY